MIIGLAEPVKSLTGKPVSFFFFSNESNEMTVGKHDGFEVCLWYTPSKGNLPYTDMIQFVNPEPRLYK